MHVPYYDVLEQFRLIYEIVYVQKATLFVKKSQVLKVAKSRNVSENFKTGSRGDLGQKKVPLFSVTRPTL